MNLGAHAQQGLQYLLFLSVSLSGLHLNSPVTIWSIKPTADFTGNKNQKFQTVFSENSLFQRYSTCALVSIATESAILFSYSEGEDTYFCELPLAPLTMPLSKVCPKCKAIVPLRLKQCNSSKHVFRAKQTVVQSLE